MKNKKLNKVGIMTITILCIIILVFIYVNFFSTNNDDIINNNPLPTSTPEVMENLINIELVEYDIYKLENEGFDFIIAKLLVEDKDDELVLNYSGFETEENLNLANISGYVKSLEENNLYLSKLDIFFDEFIDSEEYFVTMFIPYERAKDTLTIRAYDNEIIFDLDQNLETIDNLFYQSDDIITDNENYNITISNAFEITGDKIERVYEDGYREDFLYSSNSEIYAFKVDVESISDNEVVIESATYYVDNSTLSFNALNSSFIPMKYDNIIGKDIMDTDNGIFMFITNNPSKEAITYKGYLEIKIKGQDELITVKVDL